MAEEIRRGMDLQLFAGPGDDDDPNVTDDDPNAPDDDDAGDDEPVLGGDELTRRLLGGPKVVGEERAEAAVKGEPEDEEDPEEDPEAEPAEEPDEDAEADPETPDTPGAETPEPEPEIPEEDRPKFSQRDLEQKIAERLARDRKAKTLRDLEALTGKTAEQLLEEQRSAKVGEVAYEHGWDEATAKKYVEEQEELQRLRAERQQTQEERERLERMNAYTTAKNAWQANPKISDKKRALAKKYTADIDAFSDFGKGVAYEVAVDFIIGQKVDELLAENGQATEQKVLRNVEKRERVKPAKAKGGAASAEPEMTKHERLFSAAILGTGKESEYKAARKDLQRHRRQGR